MVDISPAAVTEIRRMQRCRQLPDSLLRIAIRPGGCLDFFYNLSFESQHKKSDFELNGDLLIQARGINLVVDSQSWKFVENLKLDYAEDLMGGGFRFHNPQTKKACGCGISFTVSQ